MKNLVKESDKIRFRIDKKPNGANISAPPEKLAHANEVAKRIKLPTRVSKKTA
jgi:hypothetical protein